MNMSCFIPVADSFDSRSEIEYNGFLLKYLDVGEWYFNHDGKTIIGYIDDLVAQIDAFVENN